MNYTNNAITRATASGLSSLRLIRKRPVDALGRLISREFTINPAEYPPDSCAPPIAGG